MKSSDGLWTEVYNDSGATVRLCVQGNFARSISLTHLSAVGWLGSLWYLGLKIGTRTRSLETHIQPPPPKRSLATNSVHSLEPLQVHDDWSFTPNFLTKEN